MLNNFYFTEDNIVSVSVGDKSFKEQCIMYLAESYNYSFAGLMKDTGLGAEDLAKAYAENDCPKRFIDSLMDELQFRKSNYFNIILSSERNL